jgi:septum formation topological specificity factor MinE
LVKEKTIKFSSELIRSLRQKYEVQINEDLLAQASGDMEGEILKQPIATTNKENIPLAPLVKDIRKEHSYRKLETWSAEKRAELYRGLLNGMINEYLITWESIERHYEDKPPLKWTLEYHKEKNLISELENLLFEPKVLLQEDEITKYYQDHIDDYKDPDLFTIAMLDAEKDLVEKIWQEVSRGGNIFEVARRHESILSPKEDMQLREFSPDIAAAVQKLDVDEVSPPIQGTKNRLKLVVLMDRSGGGVQTLESVKKAIIKKLRPKKFQQVKEEYVEKLKALSEIKLNQKIWNKLIADQKK